MWALLDSTIVELVAKCVLISGVDTRFKTKSAYMKFNCESRIRGYMKEVANWSAVTLVYYGTPSIRRLVWDLTYFLCCQVDEATKLVEKAKVREELLKTSKCLSEMLKSARYNGCYFNRTEEEPDRLCTREGWFTCQVIQRYKEHNNSRCWWIYQRYINQKM